MPHILVFGAGKSATVLLDFLQQACTQRGWQLTIADANGQQAAARITHPAVACAVEVRVEDAAQRQQLVEAAGVVVSLLPPHLHLLVAQTCLAAGRSLLTASYVDDELRRLAPQVQAAGLLFLCEMGLDPGIDHMSACQLLNRIRESGGQVTSFVSHCGGLIAPASDTNPWHYKISWNPRNIVRAGSGGAVYKQDHRIVHKSYPEVFDGCPSLTVPGLPPLAWYPNRDSLAYIPLYGLQEAATFLRTTLRYAPFCAGWKAVVDLGLTAEDDAATVAGCSTYDQWFSRKLQAAGAGSLKDFIQTQVPADNRATVTEQFFFLDFDKPKPLPSGAACSADILQRRLEEKLILAPGDRDLVVMRHEIGYRTPVGEERLLTSTLVVEGRDHVHTAMATTVGLPLGIAAVLLLEGRLPLTGLHIPTHPLIYEPVLRELEQLGIRFVEQEE